MSPAKRHPQAIVLHAALIIGLLFAHHWLAPPMLVTAVLLLLAALLPWFLLGRAAQDGTPAEGMLPRASPS